MSYQELCPFEQLNLNYSSVMYASLNFENIFQRFLNIFLSGQILKILKKRLQFRISRPGISRNPSFCRFIGKIRRKIGILGPFYPN